MRLNAVICSLLLAGCTPCPSSPSIAIRSYSLAQQQQIAYERNKLPKDDILREVTQDWENMRRNIR